MKPKITFILALLILAFFNYENIIAQNLSYTVKVQDHEYDLKTRKIKSTGYITVKEKITKDAELVLGFIKPGNSIYMSTGGNMNLKQKLENYINKNYNSEKINPHTEINLFSKYYIYLRPILDTHNKIRDVLFAIERRKNIKNDEYKINDFILNERKLNNSKEFSFLKDGRNINKVIKNNNLKMLIYETPEKIYYVSFKFTIEKGGKNSTANSTQNNFLINDTKTISAPFYYDIKYQNSKGNKIFLDNIKQDQAFLVQAAKKDTINPVTKKKITLVYNLKGIISPTKFSSGELTVKFMLTAGDLTLDAAGNKTTTSHSTYIKEISLKPDDVVEIKLKKNWPKMQTVFGYDPVTLKKYEYNYGIESQSFFLKLVKK